MLSSLKNKEDLNIGDNGEVLRYIQINSRIAGSSKYRMRKLAFSSERVVYPSQQSSKASVGCMVIYQPTLIFNPIRSGSPWPQKQTFRGLPV